MAAVCLDPRDRRPIRPPRGHHGESGFPDKLGQIERGFADRPGQVVPVLRLRLWQDPPGRK